MNKETNDFLKDNLEEAHTVFKSIISEMKDNNILFSYNELEIAEMNNYLETQEILSKMVNYVLISNQLMEENIDLFNEKYIFYIKYFSLYVISIIFIRIYHEIFDTSKLNEMIKYIIGMFLGSTYMYLLNKDISENKNNTKDKRELINKLETMKEDYKKNHDEVVRRIDGIFALNSGLWDTLDQEKIKNK